MTDRHAGYVVTLATPMREDDLEATLTALRMVRGVVAVDPIVADAGLWMARRAAWYEMRNRLGDALDRAIDEPEAP